MQQGIGRASKRMNAAMYHQRQHQRGCNVHFCQNGCGLLMGYEKGSHGRCLSEGFRRVIDDGDVVAVLFLCSLLCIFGTF